MFNLGAHLSQCSQGYAIFVFSANTSTMPPQRTTRQRHQIRDLETDNDALRAQSARFAADNAKLQRELRQLRRDHDKLDNEHQKLAAAVKENGIESGATAIIEQVEAENRVLRQRAPLLDQLRHPVHDLPTELRLTIRKQALRMDRPVSSSDLAEFLETKPKPIADNIILPYELRPQYFATFKQNTVAVDGLAIQRKNILAWCEKTSTEVPWKHIKSLRLKLCPMGLKGLCPPYKPSNPGQSGLKDQYMLRSCTETKHLIVEFDFSNGQGHRTYALPGPTAFKDTHFESWLRQLKKLRTVEIKVTCPRRVEGWVMFVAADVQRIVKEVNPKCEVTTGL